MAQRRRGRCPCSVQQPAERVYRVGYLAIAFREQTLYATKAFEGGLRSLGYRIGENVVIEHRFANANVERLPALAADLVRLVDIIVIGGTNPITIAAMKATTTIPIVMVVGLDPVSTGLVASLARPGGNVTGFAVDTGSEILAKRFEMLKEALPNLSRVGILFNPDGAATRSRLNSMMEIAPTLGLTNIPVEARGLDALEQAFAIMVREGAQAFAVYAAQRPGEAGEPSRAFESARRFWRIRRSSGQPSPNETPVVHDTICT